MGFRITLNNLNLLSYREINYDIIISMFEVCIGIWKTIDRLKEIAKNTFVPKQKRLNHRTSMFNLHTHTLIGPYLGICRPEATKKINTFILIQKTVTYIKND